MSPMPHHRGRRTTRPSRTLPRLLSPPQQIGLVGSHRPGPRRVGRDRCCRCTTQGLGYRWPLRSSSALGQAAPGGIGTGPTCWQRSTDHVRADQLLLDAGSGRSRPGAVPLLGCPSGPESYQEPRRHHPVWRPRSLNVTAVLQPMRRLADEEPTWVVPAGLPMRSDPPSKRSESPTSPRWRI
jgi:hypothetical protein